jgi:hypothetical protein
MENRITARQVAQWNLQGKRRCGRPVSTWKGEIRDSMQRRNLKDEEYSDRELWRKKNYVLGLRKTVYSLKNSGNKIVIKTVSRVLSCVRVSAAVINCGLWI